MGEETNAKNLNNIQRKKNPHIIEHPQPTEALSVALTTTRTDCCDRHPNCNSRSSESIAVASSICNAWYSACWHRRWSVEDGQTLAVYGASQPSKCGRERKNVDELYGSPVQTGHVRPPSRHRQEDRRSPPTRFGEYW